MKKRGVLGLIIVMTILLTSFAYADFHELPEAESQAVASEERQGQELPEARSQSNTPTEETSTGSQFDILKSVNWLKEKSKEPLTIDEMSLAIIALNNQGDRDSVSSLITRLLELKSEEGCFPKQKCTTKDTALASLALSKTGNDISKSIEWLKSQLVPGVKRGEWRLQIKAGGEGECEVTYPLREENTKTQKFQMKDEKLLGTSSPFFINVATELSGGLVNNIVNPKLTVDCHLQNPIITLLYKEGNNIYIVKNKPGKAENMPMPNACFTSGKGKACDYESTLYAALALKEIGEDLESYGVNVFLETGQNLNELNQALLSRIFKKTLYYDMLVKSQKKDGSWADRSPFITAFAVFALKEITQDVYTGAGQGGEAFLKQSVYVDGDWFGKVKDTSMAIIAITGSDLARGSVSAITPGTSDLEICDNTVDDDGDRNLDCDDGDCQTHPACGCENRIFDPGEEGIDCGGICRKSCGDEVSETSEEELDFGDEPQEEVAVTTGEEAVPDAEGGFPWGWVVGIVVILLVAGLVFYLVKSGKIKLKGKKPSFDDFKMQYQTTSRPAARPSRPTATQRYTKPTGKDDALEKSLREAEDMMKK